MSERNRSVVKTNVVTTKCLQTSDAFCWWRRISLNIRDKNFRQTMAVPRSINLRKVEITFRNSLRLARSYMQWVPWWKQSVWQSVVFMKLSCINYTATIRLNQIFLKELRIDVSIRIVMSNIPSKENKSFFDATSALKIEIPFLLIAPSVLPFLRSSRHNLPLPLRYASRRAENRVVNALSVLDCSP